MELRVSTIIDLSELKHHERILFVKRFLDALIFLPLYTPNTAFDGMLVCLLSFISPTVLDLILLYRPFFV